MFANEIIILLLSASHYLKLNMTFVNATGYNEIVILY